MKISIIIPTLNRADILESSIQSVLNQTVNNYELIIVNNASQDNTAEIVNKYKDRATVIHNKEKLNIADNWQVGFEQASGEYFIVLGDDDYLMPTFCEKVLGVLRNARGELDFLITNKIEYISYDPGYGWENIVVYSKNNFTDEVFNISPGDVFRSYKFFVDKGRLPVVPHPSLFVIRKALAEDIEKKYNIDFYSGLFPDYFSHAALGLLAERACFMSEPLVVIGGVAQKHYCYHNSKMDIFRQSSMYGEAKEFNYLLKYPYLALNVLYQTILTHKVLGLELVDIVILFKKASELGYENLCWCQSVYKDARYKRDKAFFESVLGEKALRSLEKVQVRHAFRRALVKRFVNKPVWGSMLLKLRNIKSKENVIMKDKGVVDIASAALVYLRKYRVERE